MSIVYTVDNGCTVGNRYTVGSGYTVGNGIIPEIAAGDLIGVDIQAKKEKNHAGIRSGY